MNKPITSSLLRRWAPLLAMAVLSPSVGAQDPPAAVERPTAAQITEFNNMVRGATISDQTVFELVGAFRAVEFALAENLDKLPTLRRRLKDDLRKSDSGSDKRMHEAWNALLLAKLSDLAKGDLSGFPHLSSETARANVQVNAMLMIGDLNEREPTPSGQPPAIPSAAALPKLLDALASAELSDAVKVAALPGMARHGASGIAKDEDRKSVQSAMQTLLASKAAPPTREADIHVWFRRTAAEVLGAVGRAGKTPEEADVAQSFLAVMGDAQEPLVLRCDAAHALGQLDLKSPPGMNLSLAAHQLGRLTVELAQAKNDDLTQLRSRLHRIGKGLTGDPPGRGIQAAVAEPQKAFVDMLSQQFNGVKTAVDKLTRLKQPMPPELREPVTALSTWLDANVPEKKELLAVVPAAAP